MQLRRGRHPRLWHRVSLTPPTVPGGAWAFNASYTFTGFSDGITPGNLAIGPGGILYATPFTVAATTVVLLRFIGVAPVRLP